jgi:hypothetical protein
MKIPQLFPNKKKKKHQSLGKNELRSFNFKIVGKFFLSFERLEKLIFCFMFSLYKSYTDYNNADLKAKYLTFRQRKQNFWIATDQCTAGSLHIHCEIKEI